MPKHQKTLQIIEESKAILGEQHPMTVRQVYYQLVSRLVIENTRSQYQAVSNALVGARKTGEIPWEWIEDRLRKPRRVLMWSGLANFSETVKRAYRRDVWATQSCYLEAWLEKDALSGIFEDILDSYGITLNVGRGYDGWDSIHNAAERYQNEDRVTVLYFGDFDPSGEDMVRSLRERLGFFECRPDIVKCALTAEDVTTYHLPSNFTKPTDCRSQAFVDKYGDVAVELDALPLNILQEKLRLAIETRMDLDALNEVKRVEEREGTRLDELMDDIDEE
jgi:hypothetical protein